MSECFSPLPIAIGLTKRSPLAKPLNLKIQQLKEAGLIDHWQQQGRELAGRLVEKSFGLTEKRWMMKLKKDKFRLYEITLSKYIQECKSKTRSQKMIFPP